MVREMGLEFSGKGISGVILFTVLQFLDLNYRMKAPNST